MPINPSCASFANQISTKVEAISKWRAKEVGLIINFGTSTYGRLSAFPPWI